MLRSANPKNTGKKFDFLSAAECWLQPVRSEKQGCNLQEVSAPACGFIWADPRDLDILHSPEELKVGMGLPLDLGYVQT